MPKLNHLKIATIAFFGGTTFLTNANQLKINYSPTQREQSRIEIGEKTNAQSKIYLLPEGDGLTQQFNVIRKKYKYTYISPVVETNNQQRVKKHNSLIIKVGTTRDELSVLTTNKNVVSFEGLVPLGFISTFTREILNEGYSDNLGLEYSVTTIQGRNNKKYQCYLYISNDAIEASRFTTEGSSLRKIENKTPGKALARCYDGKGKVY
jgi:hypothetical protein